MTDNEILRQFLVSSDPILFTHELAGEFDMTSQGMNKRLKNLTAEGMLDTKKTASVRVWWLTDSGRRRAADATDED